MDSKYRVIETGRTQYNRGEWVPVATGMSLDEAEEMKALRPRSRRIEEYRDGVWKAPSAGPKL